jgi:SpoVK/Ycf46/Vps4 family AAA+-type ATPase
MDFFDLKTFGGLAIFGVVASCWSKIQYVFNKLLSIFVVTVKINLGMEQKLHYYFRTHFKQIRFNTYNFDTLYLRSKIYGREVSIPYEMNENDSLIYFNGWKPIFLNSFDWGKDASSHSIIVLRGTFDIKKLIVDALKFYEERVSEYNSNKIQEDGNKRFSIYEKIGKTKNENEHGNNEKETKPESVSDEWIESAKIGLYNFIWHRPEDIGYEAKYSKNYIDYLYYPPEVLNEITSDLEYWLDYKDWYIDKGIPWKRGTLLYGTPGTGKTSLVRAIGEKYDLPIVSFNIHSLTNNELMEEWKKSIASHSPCIFLIEDIDNIFHGREKAQADMMNKHVTFDCLLNVMDGSSKDDGYYLFMTTNKIDQLDSALGIPHNDNSGYSISTRPGRIDRVIELKNIDKDGREQIAHRIMGDIVPLCEINNIIQLSDGDTPAQFLERCRSIAVKYHIKKKLLNKEQGE